MRKGILLVFFLVFSLNFFAQEDKIIRKIEVRGNRRVSSFLILSQVKSREGEKLSPRILGEDIKRIFKLGYFSDVSADVEDVPGGVKITFLVVEKPYVESIQIEGNQRISEEDILKTMVLAVGDIFREDTLKEDVERIHQLYEKKGFYQAKIQPKWKKVDGKIRVELKIEEGPRMKVMGIVIKGNKAIPTKRILKVMKTRKAGFLWKGVFGKEILEEDKERIEKLYQKEGYLDAKVVKEDLKIDPSGRFLTITLYIQEGERYSVEKVDITGNRIFSRQKLLQIISLKEGTPYNPFQAEKDAQSIENYYGKFGYITTRVWAIPDIDRKEKKVRVRYEIEEGQKIYVRLVEIRGNIKTKDKVIRREILIKPGEVFNGEKVKRSREKIFNLGYFRDVKVRTRPTDKPDYYDLIFEVEERKTGIFTFGVGYSEIEGGIGFVQIQQNNFDITNPPSFVGGGQKLALTATLGRWREDYTLSFTEPYFLDRPISLGFDLYNTLREWDVYDERRRGGNIRVGKRLSPDLWVSSRYRYEMIKLFNLSDDVGSEIKEEEGRNDISAFQVGFTYDTRDNVFDPSRGNLRRGSVEIAGGILGGDFNFYKWKGEYTHYLPWREKYVWSFHIEGGVVENYPPSRRVPLYERFFLGGPYTLRGYSYRDVGPQDEEGNPIGGGTYALFNLEFKYPIAEVLKGILFLDMGEVWKSPSRIRLKDLKESIGAGLRVHTPMGLVRIDYGFALERKKGRLHFSFGFPF